MPSPSTLRIPARRCRLLRIAILCCVGARLSLSAEVLTSLSAIHRMPVEMAAKGLPVVAEGVVTDTGGWPYGLTVQDGNEGLYVGLAAGAPRVEAGQRIVVRGSTSEGRFAPIVQAAKIELKGRKQMPAPYAASARELASGELDNRLVEVRGVVRATAAGVMGDGSGVFMVVDLNPGTVHVAVARGLHLDVTPFVDATIRAAGVVGVEFNSRRQALGATVVVNRLEDISVIRQPSASALSGPPTPMAEIFRWGSNQDWSHRIKVNGVLTLQRPGEFMILQDHGQAVRVQSLESRRLPLGTRFDVAGFAVPEGYGPVLADAVVGKQRGAETIEPLARRASAISPGDDNWLLIRLKARLVESHESGAGLSLSLEDDGTRFIADAPGSAARQLANIPPGSELQLTGINEVLLDALRRTRGFRLLIRSADDVRVLRAGFWLNGTRLLGSVLALGFVALLCGLWALALRSRVRSQTALISASLERERAAAGIHAERGRILGLIGRNTTLPRICVELLQTIASRWPQARVAIGIESADTSQWFGDVSDLPSGEQREVLSSSGALRARVVTMRGAPGELLDLCRECLSIAVEHRDLQDRLVRQSLSDPLTLLPNRRALDAHLDRVLPGAKKKKNQCAILVLDMDGFKTINDTLGHAAGDIVLTTLAQRFSGVMRRSDLIARVGGDEFVAVLENIAGPADAEELAARLAVVASAPIEISGMEIRPALSVGMALFPADGDSAQVLKDVADSRMYRLKMMHGSRPPSEVHAEPAGHDGEPALVDFQMTR